MFNYLKLPDTSRLRAQYIKTDVEIVSIAFRALPIRFSYGQDVSLTLLPILLRYEMGASSVVVVEDSAISSI